MGKFKTDFTANQLVELFDKVGPMESIYHGSQYSLAWLVQNIFRDKTGKPFRLEPFQNVILDVMWNKKFPMIIATRGASKTTLFALYACLRSLLIPGHKIIIVGNGYRQAKIVFKMIEELYNASPLFQEAVGPDQYPKYASDAARLQVGLSSITALPLGDGCLSSYTQITYDNEIGTIYCDKSHLRSRGVWSNGSFEISNEAYDNGFKPTLKIITNNGYNIEGTYNHKLKIIRNQEIQWCRLDEMKINDYILIDRTKRWHNNINEVTKDEAYSLGLMIGDGCWTSKYKLGFATHDIELIDPLNKGISNFTPAADKEHWNLFGKNKIQNWLNYWNLEKCYSHQKYLPQKLLQASKEIVAECLAGIFDTDGHIFTSTLKGGHSVSVNLTSTSEKLINQIQYILLHFGIISTVRSRQRNNKNWRKVYELCIQGHKNCQLFANNIGFKLNRKNNQLIQALQKQVRNCNINDIIPNIKDIMYDIAINNRIKKGHDLEPEIHSSTIKRKKNITHQFCRKFLNKYSFTNDDRLGIIKILCNSNIYYDTILSIEKSQSHTYDMHVPSNHTYCANGFISHNSTIRGYRANCVLADEFGSIPEDVFNTVVAPFTVTHSNPAEKAAIIRFVKRLKSLGAPQEVVDSIYQLDGFGNQIIIAGTATYEQNHFFKRYSTYKMFIDSNGNQDKLKKALEEKSMIGNGKSDSVSKEDIESLAKIWNQYAIVQLPYHALPEGFLDEDQIRSDKATFSSSRFKMEYLGVFPSDSDGFIKRSWIERATPKAPDEIPVNPELYGDLKSNYVLGVDPARYNDNCAAIVLKLTSRGKELVYCDAWDRTKFETSAQKIREICLRFNIQYIAMDHGGGGESIREWLCKKQDSIKDENLIWVIPDQIEKYGNKSDLGAPGRKILEMVNFVPNWISDAAHNIEACVEQRNILFPYKVSEEEIFNQYLRHFKGEEMSEAIKIKLQADVWGIDDWEAEQYKTQPRLGVMNHINECINETCAIMRIVTNTGVEKFELPRVSEQLEGLDMRRRDRWSAFMLANYAAKVFSGHGHKISSAIPGNAGSRKGRGFFRNINRRGQAIWFNPNK